MDNCMSIKQARLIVNAHKHNLLINSFCNRLRLLPECHSLSIKTDTGNNYINTGKKNPLTGRKEEESTTDQNKDLSIVRQELTDMHGIGDFLPAAAHWCVFLRESHGL